MSTIAIQEDFKEIRRIDEGGFGRIYLVEVLNRTFKKNWGKDRVCIKVPKDKEKEMFLIKEVINNEVVVKTFQIAKSENLVEYIGFCHYRGYYSMIMEYVEGPTLRAKIGRIGLQKPLGILESLRIAKQVCKALSQLHKCKIFHRDIKPENIFICKNQIVKLSDLGISKRMDSAEKASTVAGTWPYMAREVLCGKGDLQSDIHSLGVILYEMVTGKLPFGDAYQEVIKNLNNPRFKVDSPKEYIREYNKDIDDVVIEEVDNMILKAIGLDLTRSYKTIDELYQEINDILERLEKPKEDFELCIKEAKKLRNIGQTAKAERKYKEVLKNFPNNPRSYYYLSEFYNYVRIPYKAKNILSEGIKRFPGSSLLHYNLALTLHETEDPKALKELEKAIEIGLPEKVEKTAKLLLMAWKSRH
ncbi:MAG TPA: serine/threonine-protein kinase [Candidatus Atribacteria bacterium]|nr:MAG: hypothetical protein DRP41_00040 [Thermodesulfobacteriota bacterium]RKY44928.1 MAG: hypothetical protein DRP81_04955 [Candidatus Omnitrophota bacterium]HDK26445.1 serine/threonine-protein kinase [Candidatus Atribacteria bacterium]